MDVDQPPRQFNVVFHFKVPRRDKVFTPLEGFSARHFHNFIVLRRGKVTFTLFFKSGHVNSSGTETFDQISATLTLANKLFDTDLTTKDITITSSTWSGCFNHTALNIPSTRESLHLAVRHIRVSLRPSRFPGAVIRRKNHPTLVVFRNGKYVIVGAKSAESVSTTIGGIRPHLRCLCCAASPSPHSP
jgi:TATA-box binding protein (TBP) (component of TFIID and TFIIIB)